jgi:hypothetical protein
MIVGYINAFFSNFSLFLSLSSQPSPQGKFLSVSLSLSLSVSLSVSVCLSLSSNRNGWQVPCYVFLGKTSLEEWKSCIQKNLGPWGELATDNVILTVPTASLKTLENPEPLLQLWDEMMQAVARLASQPFPFQRPERIVADVQLSAGGCFRGVLLVSKVHLLFLYL